MKRYTEGSRGSRGSGSGGIAVMDRADGAALDLQLQRWHREDRGELRWTDDCA